MAHKRWIRHDATPESLSTLKERIGTRRLMLGVSGGKDSAATAVYLNDLGIPFEAAFMDTGWELPETYAYLRDVLPEFTGPIRVLKLDMVFCTDDDERFIDLNKTFGDETVSPIQIFKSRGLFDGVQKPAELKPLLEAAARYFERLLGFSSPMVRLILHKGIFPSRVRRFCTQLLKVKPAMTYIQNHEDEILNVVGIRAEESAVRAAYPEWEWDEGYDCEIWRPVLNARFDDIVRLHHRHGVPPSPLYIKGASRVGCAPCIYARKHEIRMLYSIAPARFKLLQLLEKDIEVLALARAARKDEVREHPPPTWFQDPSSRSLPTGRWICTGCRAVMTEELASVSRPEGARHSRDDVVVDRAELHGPSCAGPAWKKESKRAGGCWPIEKIITWSHTKRGGREFEPFAPMPSEEGCMRWGLCDTSWRGSESDDGAQLISEVLDLEDVELNFEDEETDCAPGASPPGPVPTAPAAFPTFEGQTKTCPRCGQTLDIEEGFGVRRIRKVKKGPVVRIIPQSYCRSCRTTKKKPVNSDGLRTLRTSVALTPQRSE
jgi:3'-phosphoadenosine 5'-phosphosulfate sulfotransferase (PAPS reductase)/FAD synthetase